MANYSLANTLREAMLSQIRGLTTTTCKYTVRNCVGTDAFEPPAKGWASFLVEVLCPSIMRSGAGGGAYINDVSVHVALFCRDEEDSLGERDKVQTKLLEEFLLICQSLEGSTFSGILEVPLYMSEAPHQPSPFILEDGQVHGVSWIYGVFKGQKTWTTAEFKALGPEVVP
jgi:hypothetical protein